MIENKLYFIMPIIQRTKEEYAEMEKRRISRIPRTSEEEIEDMIKSARKHYPHQFKDKKSKPTKKTIKMLMKEVEAEVISNKIKTDNVNELIKLIEGILINLKYK